MFRRQRDAKRSLNPAHPVVAAGPLADWIVAGHDRCVLSCGPGSPFEKLIEKDAKALFVDVALPYLMFFHYLEHMVHESLRFPLYSDETETMAAIDAQGEPCSVPTRPFTTAARKARKFSVLEDALRAQGMVHSRRLGNTLLQVVRIRDSVTITEQLAARGVYFYEPA